MCDEYAKATLNFLIIRFFSK